ncbi:copper amine oxidase N-terminal domain-containing protein [Paenibacillus sp. KQZ6P-2]|uniref:Copper amine oxidase N-terminal domain-containing protein n=1 Tax=Paenibacillus mangrovi TaxID=2931978 RepID=A0A9X1WQV0_9BACL|nr:copper amine oxidase N-terminal domain-containing protein [Paenibacillus mangrovi]MCJ8013647.1 copper amine oxidase N-terminal domain-containing protein [Paenibacillus mangrovi]
MKKAKIFIAAMTVIAAFSGLTKHSYASSFTIEKNVPVLLQINEFDVLYTFPKQPYLDENHRLMIPLRAVSELIGAKVSYDSASKTASIQLNDKVLKITAGSKDIEVNNVAKTIDTIPVMYKQSLFIPVRALIDHLNLQAKVDPKTGLVHLESELLDKYQMIELMKESDLSSDSIEDNYAILPLRYDLTLSGATKGELQNGSIAMTAQNVTGKAIAQGKEDLHIIFMFEHAFQMEADWNTTDQNNERPRPALHKDQTFNRVEKFTASNYDEKLKYILAVGRIFK